MVKFKTHEARKTGKKEVGPSVVELEGLGGSKIIGVAKIESS